MLLFYVCSTHKILGISTVARSDHAIAQTRELQCTKVVIPQVIARGIMTMKSMYMYKVHTHNMYNVCIRVVYSTCTCGTFMKYMYMCKYT